MSADIGSELKKAREALGLSLEEMTERTMIPKKYLKALENERFSLFPGEVYAKGALRKYATILGLDAQDLITRFNQYMAKEGEDSVDTLNQESVTAHHKPRAKKRNNSGKKQKIPRQLAAILIILSLLVAVYFLAKKIMTDDSQSNNPPINGEENMLEDQAKGEENAEEDEVTEPTDEEPEDEEPEAPPVTVTRDPNTDKVRFIVTNADHLRAKLILTDACWIRIMADGNEVLSGTFRSNQSATAVKEMSIRLGNPPAVSLEINEQEVQLPDTPYAYTLTIVLIED